VHAVGGLPDPQLVGKLELGVGQEREGGIEAGLERSLYLRRIDRDDGDFAIGNLGSTVELDQFPQLNLSLGSPGAAKEDQDQGLTVRQLRDRALFSALIHEGERGKFVPDLIAECHDPSSPRMLPTKGPKA
jgi:hypothetical protein